MRGKGWVYGRAVGWTRRRQEGMKGTGQGVGLGRCRRSEFERAGNALPKNAKTRRPRFAGQVLAPLMTKARSQCTVSRRGSHSLRS